MILYIVLGAIILAVLWVISTYNFFLSAKTRVNAAVQEIGNQLKRQVDLIPNLEASAKGYLKHEKEIFRALTDARRQVSQAVSSGDLGKMASAGSKISAVLPQLRIAVESNPEIKGAEVVKPLMEELRDTADKIMYARRLLIDLTADYNERRVTFPSSIVASMFNVADLKGLEMSDSHDATSVSSEEMKTPEINL